MGKVTPKQIRALWTLSGRVRIPEHEVRGWVAARVGKRSIRALSKREASLLISELLEVMAGRAPLYSAHRMTSAQEMWIGALGEMIGWSESRISGLAKKMYSEKGMRTLSRREASGLIEALKSISERRLSAKVA
ncbi:MAG: phage protein GemA/Gp16 family protein [Nitrospiria bacterium]